jgi:hypothetical protein
VEENEPCFTSNMNVNLLPKRKRRFRLRKSQDDDEEDSSCDTVWKIVAVVSIGMFGEKKR